MSVYLVQESDMTRIADAIREKTGKTDKISFDDMVSEISGISTGVELNFDVVGGTTKPSNVTENTIWVNTNNTITSWIFSAIQPSNSTEGLVWFQTGTTSVISFNALKTNTVDVYPMSIKQYVSGIWVDKEAQIYQNSVWADFILVLPVEKALWTTSRANYGVISTSYTDGVFTCNSSNGGSSAGMGETNLIYTPLIDCAPYKTLTLLGSCTMATQYNCPQTVYLKDGSTTVLSKSLANFTDRFELDVTNISKKCTLSVYANHGMDSRHTLKLTGIELK